MDTDTLRYTQTGDGQTHVQLFNSPIGNPNGNGWQLRQTSLLGAQSTQATQAGALPFSTSVSSIGGTQPWVKLSTGDKSISLDPLTVDGQPPRVAAPLQQQGVALYPNATSFGTDLALRQTVSGITVDAVLHNAAAPADLTFRLSVSPQATAALKPDGSIAIASPEQGCGSTGCMSYQATDFLLQPAVVSDSAAGAPLGSLFRHVSYNLAGTASGVYQLTVRVDPNWLRDAHRVSPVALHVPMVTAAAADKSGIFSTVSSCEAAAVDPSAQLVVGTEGACTYHGIAYFDATTLPFQAQIESATLNFYTTDGAAAAGVQVLPNQPSTALPPPHPWINANPAAPHVIIAPPATAPRVTPPPLPQLQQGVIPSWATAPLTAPSAAARAQSGSDAHWKRWDVTDLVRQWIQNRWTNTGLTLVNAGAPVTFMSPLGAGVNDPATAGYLDVTYKWAPEATTSAGATPAAMSSCPHLPNPVRAPYCDGASTIYGVGGVFWPDGTCKGADACTAGIEYQTVFNLLAGGYTRLYALNIPCAGFTSSLAFSPLYATMKRSLADGLIPIVTFNQENPPIPGDPSCQPDWFTIMENFVFNMPDMTYPTFGANPPMYFELGNEENCGQSCSSKYNFTQYPTDFSRGAAGMNYAFSYYIGGRGSLYTNYHILTGGVIAPTTALQNCPNSLTINTIPSAILDAQYYGIYSVPASHLGVAVHPYSYATNEGGYWRNYVHSYITACADLDSMIVNWTGEFAGMPVMITEINYTSLAPYDNTQEGMYLIDLFTWLYDHLGYQYMISYPVRLIWFTGADGDSAIPTVKNFGIFTFNPSPPPGSSGDKVVGPIYCPIISSYPYPYWFQPIRTMFSLLSSDVLAPYPYGSCY